LASSRATMNSVDDLSLSAGPFGAAPRNTTRSISPGCEAIDWLRGYRCIACSSPSHAASDHRHALRTRLPQVPDSGQNIQMKRRVHRIGVAGASRFTVAAEVERQHSKPCTRQRSSLLPPALLVELTTVGQHDGSIAISINIGADYASILGRKRNGCLPGRVPRNQQCHNDRNERTHAVTVTSLWRCCRPQKSAQPKLTAPIVPSLSSLLYN
jgi:hypothetical protein